LVGGSGLSGLAERVAEFAGADFEAGPLPVGGFRLRVSLPLRRRRTRGRAVTVRVLLAEDQAMVRGALSALLSLEEDIEIVAEASRGDEVLPAALDALPDVALLDIEMPGGDGLGAAAELRDRLPSCHTIILTTFGRAGLPQAGDGEWRSGLPA
jgi:CheY-like chemotaxis protein